jgi:hypothetical protein
MIPSPFQVGQLVALILRAVIPIAVMLPARMDGFMISYENDWFFSNLQLVMLAGVLTPQLQG